MKRYSVLTFIINNYEVVHEIEEKDPEAEYILVTDNPNTHSDTWNVVYEKFDEGLSVWERCCRIRYNCFKYCNTDICIRIDGSIGIKRSLKPLIDVFIEGKYDAALMPHPIRNNLIDEYRAWVKERHYQKKRAKYGIGYLRQYDYDFGYKGLFQLCIAIQKRGSITDEIDRQTIHLMKEMGNGQMERIDQIPFTYVMNTNFSHLKILPLSEQVLYSTYMQWYRHASDMPLVTFEIDENQYLFNSKVDSFKLQTAQETAEFKEYVNRLTMIIRLQKGEKERLHKRYLKYKNLFKIFALLASILLFCLIFSTVGN